MRKWLNSAGYALKGIILLFKKERNARIESCAALIILFLGVWLEISKIEFCLILFCIGAVLTAEAFNSAIERLSDLHTQDHHSGIGPIKDISAGAVLMTAIASFLIGMIIFGPKLLERIGMI